MSKMSGRNNGSPPERTKIGRAKAAIWSINSNDSAVVRSWGSSLSATVMRRQWIQAKLQPAVVSQKTSLGGG